MKWYWKVSAKAYVAALAPALIMLLVLAPNLLLYINESIDKNLKDQTLQHASYLASSAQFVLQTGETQSFESVARNIFEESDLVSVRVVDNENIVLVDLSSTRYPDNDEFLIQYSKPVYKQIISFEDGHFENTKEKIGTVTVFVSSLNANAKRTQELFTASIMTVFALSMILFIGRFMSKSITTPMAGIINSVRELSKNNFNVRINSPLKNEFGALSNGLDKLAVQLESYEASLKQEIMESENARMEAVKAQEQADRANVSKSQFLALISHEIRNPISGAYQLLEALEGMPLDSRASAFVRLGLDAMDPLFLLLDDIIDFSTLEFGELSIQKSTFKLSDVLNSVYKLCKVKADQKHIALGVEYHHQSRFDAGYYMTDQTRLRQILTNLISNAIKFTPKNGKVLVCCKVESNPVYKDSSDTYWLTIEVSDTGIGISEENQNEIFKMFKQLNPKVDTREHGGFGLGLALCKHLCQLLEGSISVRSQPGKGSTFTVKIPVGLSATPAINKNLEQSLFFGSQDPLRILLVEDDATIQAATSALLASVNIRLDIADNAQEALNLYEQNRYDLIFVDCYLPGINGFQLTKEIRNREKKRALPQTPIIGQSASALPGTIEEALDSGMNDFLTKPYKRIQLYEKIQRHFQWESTVENILKFSVSKVS